VASGQGADLYIDIRDFTRGIASSRHSLGGAQPAPEDQEAASVFAQEADTWGCYGHPAGGLHPLPGVVLAVEDPGDDWPDDPLPGAAKASGSPTWSAHPRYTGTKNLVVNASMLVQMEPVYTDAESALYNSTTPWRKSVTQTPDQLHILYGGYGKIDGQSTVLWFQGSWEWRVFEMGRNPVVTYDLMGGHLADDDARDSLGQRVLPFNENLTRVGFDDPDIWGREFMALGMTPANLVVATSGLLYNWTFSDPAWNQDPNPNGSITAPGTVVAVALCSRVGIWPNLLQKNYARGAYPNLNIETYIIDPIGTSPVNGKQIAQGLVHQGRIVFTTRTDIDVVGQNFGPTGRLRQGDAISYYPANDLISEPTVQAYRFMPENPGTIGVIASMNANELIAIKHQGGGGLLRGDVSKPQFVALPGLPSIQGATNIPVVTPMGLVFGTRDGVYVWQGSEGAESISQQLDGWFWQPEGTPDLEDGLLFSDYPHRGKFNVSGYLVYAPNNWVYDMRTGGWFRLNPTTRIVEGVGENPDVTYTVGYRNYEVSSTGRVYAIKPIVTEDDLTVAHLYDRDVPTHQYRWRSQPIPRTINRRVDVREVVLTAQGSGTVTVTVVGVEGQEDAVTFDVDSPDQPRVYTKSVNVISEDVEVQIDSEGDATPTFTDDGVPYAVEGSPAPSVYRVSLGVRNGPSVSRDGTLVRTPRP
jgi:hypothetical protein